MSVVSNDTRTHEAIPFPHKPRARRPGLTLALLAFAMLIVSLDYNIVYVALPKIGSGLRFSNQSLQLVVSAYAVAFGGLLLLGGRASDLLGRRRMFILGLLLYGVSSLAGGLAPAGWVLIAARAVQGIGGAVLFPATLSLINTSFAEGPERNRALSVWAGAGASGMVLGSLLGGVLTQALGWEAVFFVNVPLAALATVAALSLLAADAARDKSRRFDLPGGLTGTVGTTLLVYTLAQGPAYGWGSTRIVICAVLAVVLLAMFVVIEARSTDPLMPLRLFANRNLSTGVATTFVFMVTFGTLLYFLTVYFQRVHGYTALATGCAFLVPMGAILIGSNIGGRLATMLGVRCTMLISLPLGALGTLLLALAMSPHGSYGSLLPGLIVLSFGQGVTFTTMFSAAASGVAPQEQGIASGMASSSQQIGSALGLAVLVAIANSPVHGQHGQALLSATTHGLRTAVLIAAAGIAAMILIALNFDRGSTASTEPAAAEHQPEPHADTAAPSVQPSVRAKPQNAEAA